MWDGLSTTDADRDALRAEAAVIFQDFIRYALPARDNIALGRHARRDDEDAIRAAARRAGAHEDIERLSQGYDTMLGPPFEGGTDLSLGRIVEAGTYNELMDAGGRYAELFTLQAAAYR